MWEIRRLIVTGSAVAAATLSSEMVRAVDITACGQTVPRRETGVLQADLSCPTLGDAVTMEDGATLDLNGHTIESSGVAVRCGPKRCTVHGPGQIAAPDLPALPGTGIVFRKRLVVSDLSVSGMDVGIVNAESGRLDATNVDVSGNGNGILAYRVRADGLIANGNTGLGINATFVKGSDIEASGNGNDGIIARKVKAESVTANGNGLCGIRSDLTSRITGLTATGNGGPGYLGSLQVRLDDSTVTGNDDDVGGEGIDIASKGRPTLQNTTCGRSVEFSPDLVVDPDHPEVGFLGSWGVCAED